MSGPRAGWLESVGGAELDVARELIERRFRLQVVSTVAAAERLLRDSPLQLMVLAQPRRGVWSQCDCERLHAAAPLTRLLGVHGSWCEGWQRTGHPWQGVEHVYWHQVAGRLPALLAAAALPRTADAGERLSCPPVDPAPTQPARPRRVAVSAAPDARDALADALRLIGCEVTDGKAAEGEATEGEAAEGEAAEGEAADGEVAARAADETKTAAPEMRCDAVIWDGDPRQEGDLQRLRRLAAAHARVPRLALTIAPRLADWRLLLQHVDTVISKPFPLEDLLCWHGLQRIP